MCNINTEIAPILYVVLYCRLTYNEDSLFWNAPNWYFIHIYLTIEILIGNKYLMTKKQRFYIRFLRYNVWIGIQQTKQVLLMCTKQRFNINIWKYFSNCIPFICSHKLSSPFKKFLRVPSMHRHFMNEIPYKNVSVHITIVWH